MYSKEHVNLEANEIRWRDVVIVKFGVEDDSKTCVNTKAAAVFESKIFIACQFKLFHSKNVIWKWIQTIYYVLFLDVALRLSTIELNEQQ